MYFSRNESLYESCRTELRETSCCPLPSLPGKNNLKWRIKFCVPRKCRKTEKRNRERAEKLESLERHFDILVKSN